MKILKGTIMFITLTLILTALFFFIYASLFKYHPKKKEVIFQADNASFLPIKNEYSCIIWNIGYSGLDKNMDFFYDGGEKMRTSKEQTIKNLEHIQHAVKGFAPFDFFMMQEVDVESHRSYKINQLACFSAMLDTYHVSFARNYDVPYVPLPLKNPMGKVLSGIATYSFYKPFSSIRHSFSVNFPWPKSVFMLNRCFLVNRYKLENGKEFLLINLHNSAFDEKGFLRQAESLQLKKLLEKEYADGNYMVVGGDWNQSPTGFVPNFDAYLFDSEDAVQIIENLMPADWTWAYDSSVPSNRRVKYAFDKEKIPTTVIDFFLLSPNVKMKEIKTLDLGFEHSDHNPVKLIFELDV